MHSIETFMEIDTYSSHDQWPHVVPTIRDL
jgi:hypothetical protein